MPSRPPSSRNEKLRRYFLVQGILNELTDLASQPGSAFEIWDAVVGLSAKAKRLAAANQKVLSLDDGEGRKKRRAMLLAQEEATAFHSASGGSDLLGSGVFHLAGEFVRDEIEWLQGSREPWTGEPDGRERGFKYSCGCVQVMQPASLGALRCARHRFLFDSLSGRLIDRFVRWAAARGGWPLASAPEVPDAWDATVGERLTLTIPADYPVSIAREWLEHFHARAVATLDAAERAAHEPGRPATADMAALRRMGRTYFLLELKRPPRPAAVDVGHQYDAAAGREHGKRDCYCHKAVSDDVARAAEILASLES